jgi:hypothetical protein
MPFAKRGDLVELLVACGAEIKAVPFTDVLLGWEPRIIQFFIDNGADIITGSPFAVEDASGRYDGNCVSENSVCPS